MRPGLRISLSLLFFTFALIDAAFAAAHAQQQSSEAVAESVCVDLPDLPLSPTADANLSAFAPEQTSLPAPLPRRGVHSPKSRIESLQLQLGFLQADQKHATRVYFRDHHHQHGHIKSIDADSFTLQISLRQPDKRIAYFDVDRVTQEPTDSEKFARITRSASLMILGIPLMPFMLLMQATQN